MIIIAHRINTLAELQKVPLEYGVEVDIRGFGEKLILNHEPLQDGQDFLEYLEHFRHAFIILNIKETGIEQKVLQAVSDKGIKNYFLLDVEAPYIYKSTKKGPQDIAIRYSEVEPLENAALYGGKANWLWIDVCTKLPLDSNIVDQIKNYKTCLVSPECWGRPQDIKVYQEQMKALGFLPTAVMTDLEYASLWNLVNP